MLRVHDSVCIAEPRYKRLGRVYHNLSLSLHMYRPDEKPSPRKRSPVPAPPRVLRPTIVLGIVVIVAVASFAGGWLLADGLSEGDGNSDGQQGKMVTMTVSEFFEADGNSDGQQGKMVTMTVSEFFEALSSSVDNENLTMFSSIQEVDTLRITGKIVQMVSSTDDQIGEYTSLFLYYTNETNLLIHVLGNITQDYEEEDRVVATLHVIYRQDQYPGLYGETWTLMGEFFTEQFLDGKFAGAPILPPDQIKLV